MLMVHEGASNAQPRSLTRKCKAAVSPFRSGFFQSLVHRGYERLRITPKTILANFKCLEAYQ
jgi:hypothetical protein